MLRFQRTEHNKFRAPVQVSGIDDPALPELLGVAAYQKLVEDVYLLSGAVSRFDQEKFLAGTMTPVFFGSALNNFGVEAFLEAVLDLAPPPLSGKPNRVSSTRPATSSGDSCSSSRPISIRVTATGWLLSASAPASSRRTCWF